MKTQRIAVPLIAVSLFGLTACGGASDSEKQTVLQEVAKRGFTDVTLAPDIESHRTVYVYATYKGCRLRLEVLDGKISYGDLQDVSSVVLDQQRSFQPCRDAVAGAQPGGM